MVRHTLEAAVYFYKKGMLTDAQLVEVVHTLNQYTGSSALDWAAYEWVLGCCIPEY